MNRRRLLVALLLVLQVLAAFAAQAQDRRPRVVRRPALRERIWQMREAPSERRERLERRRAWLRERARVRMETPEEREALLRELEEAIEAERATQGLVAADAARAGGLGLGVREGPGGGPGVDGRRLSPEARARLRARWAELSPAERRAMRERLAAFRARPPEERARVRARLARWLEASDAERAVMQEKAERWRALSPDEQDALRERWRKLQGMDPEARRRAVTEALGRLAEDAEE
ncbi:MAG TPA: DUF3106 domain-containing protein [Myxococcota bacterium]|nr:DUF3106 domain-containing protein [Myxococcota bacterium]